ncbi:MAG: hypothetical protein ABSD20_21920 [Terriglobales bacterium]|jgi:hypothetical protein
MRGWRQPGANLELAAEKRRVEELHSTDSDLERKYWLALALYVVLAFLAWFTMGEGKVLVAGRLVELRLVPLVIISGMALKTVLARHADKIRRDGEKDSF